MRALVVGANGLLGGNVAAAAIDRLDSVVTTYHSTEPGFDCPSYGLDITSQSDVFDIVSETDPDVLVNCAAMTDVDECESDPERAHAVNAEGAQYLAQAADAIDAELIHTSTDYVFAGGRTTPYVEDVEPNPLQVYGESKLAGERRVRETHSSPLIVRLSFVYGRSYPGGSMSGFPAWVLERAAAEDDIPLFTDQRITPSYAQATARTLLDLLATNHRGTFHVASRSCVTPYEFGKLIVDKAGFDNVRLIESSMDQVERSAERPRYTCLDVTSVEEALERPQSTLVDDLGDLF